jgi:hypothetical protein
MRWRADIVRALEITAEGAHSVLEHRYVTRVERPAWAAAWHRAARHQQEQRPSVPGCLLRRLPRRRRARRSGRPPARIAVAGHAARQHQHGRGRGHAPARLCGCFRTQLRVGHPRGPDTAEPGLAGDAAPMRMLLPSSVLIGSSHFCPYGGRKQNG